MIVPGGKFGAEPAPPGTEFTYTVRLPERFSSPEAFGEIVIRTKEDGSQVKLKNLATVNLGVETYQMITRLNKKTSAVIGVYQAPGSNAVELAANVKKSEGESPLSPSRLPTKHLSYWRRARIDCFDWFA